MNLGRPILENIIKNVAGDRELVTDVSLSGPYKTDYIPGSYEPPRGLKWCLYLSQLWQIGENIKADNDTKLFFRKEKDTELILEERISLDRAGLKKRLGFSDNEVDERLTIAKRMQEIAMDRDAKIRKHFGKVSHSDLVVVSFYKEPAPIGTDIIRHYLVRRRSVEALFRQASDIYSSYQLRCDYSKRHRFLYNFSLAGSGSEESKEGIFRVSADFKIIHGGEYLNENLLLDFAHFIEVIGKERTKIDKFVRRMAKKPKARQQSVISGTRSQFGIQY